MNDQTALAFFLSACAMLSLILAVILAIQHQKKKTTGEKDFIDAAIEKKRESLKKDVPDMNFSTYRALFILFPVSFGVLSLLFVRNVFCIPLTLFGFFIPDLLVKIKKVRNDRSFPARYAGALKVLSSSLRSGLTIEQSVQKVGTNPFVDEKIRDGFCQIYSDIAVGTSLEKAFQTFAEQFHSEDAKDVATAISMQNRVGGSEAEVISSIADSINRRLLMKREIKALFADTDILIIAMDLLPWITLFGIKAFSPQIIQPFFDSAGMFALLIGIMIFTSLGSIIIRKKIAAAKGEKK